MSIKDFRVNKNYKGSMHLPTLNRIVRRNNLIRLSEEDLEKQDIRFAIKTGRLVEVTPAIAEDTPVEQKSEASENKMQSWDGQTKQMVNKEESDQLALNTGEQEDELNVQTGNIDFTQEKIEKPKKGRPRKDKTSGVKKAQKALKEVADSLNTSPLVGDETPECEFVFKNNEQEIQFVDIEQEIARRGTHPRAKELNEDDSI